MRILFAPFIAFMLLLSFGTQTVQAKQFSVFACKSEVSAVYIAEQFKRATELPILVKAPEDCRRAPRGAFFHTDLQVSTWVMVWGPEWDVDGEMFGVYKSMASVYFIMWKQNPNQEVQKE